MIIFYFFSCFQSLWFYKSDFTADGENAGWMSSLAVICLFIGTAASKFLLHMYILPELPLVIQFLCTSIAWILFADTNKTFSNNY